MSNRLYLVHWQKEEAEEWAVRLREAGWDVVGIEHEDGARAVKLVLESRPDVALISLLRLPSHGRRTAENLRSRKAGQQLRVVFVGGLPEVVERAREEVPGAEFMARDADFRP